jgi:hypothetical protein
VREREREREERQRRARVREREEKKEKERERERGGWWAKTAFFGVQGRNTNGVGSLTREDGRLLEKG